MNLLKAIIMESVFKLCATSMCMGRIVKHENNQPNRFIVLLPFFTSIGLKKSTPTSVNGGSLAVFLPSVVVLKEPFFSRTPYSSSTLDAPQNVHLQPRIFFWEMTTQTSVQDDPISHRDNKWSVLWHCVPLEGWKDERMKGCFKSSSTGAFSYRPSTDNNPPLNFTFNLKSINLPSS